jgi:hypothetical protein
MFLELGGGGQACRSDEENLGNRQGVNPSPSVFDGQQQSRSAEAVSDRPRAKYRIYFFRLTADFSGRKSTVATHVALWDCNKGGGWAGHRAPSAPAQADRCESFGRPPSL